ncbi:MAG TPA: CHAT domain-containing protein, partial [Vicinamibacteria bacterium]
MAQSELEIGLHRRDAFLYTVELRYVSPAGGADDFVAGEARLDFDKLRSFGLDDAAYGSELSQSLFGDQSLRVRFAQVLKAAEVQDDALRLRLFIGPTAPELQTLRWERLRDPESNRPLFTKHRVHFSRYLSSRDWRPVQMRTRSSLRALLVIANPENLAEKGLPPIDPKLELELAESSLQEANVVKLVGRGEATLENVLQHQLRGGYDILYLVCHGVFDEKRSRAALYLENAHGKAEFVDGTEFAHRLEELSTRPRLIVLASCDSAGSLSDDENAPNQLAALGPRLSQAGIPAVIAMQGRISMETGKAFMKVFFEELQKDGVVDRAASVARSAVQDRPDWWKPVLFMRLRTGRLWYSRGLDKGRLDQWDVLVRKIEKQKCTPILGPALNDYLLGGRREIVRRWAEREHYPLALDRESLPQVAQYLKSRHDSFTMRDKLNEFFSSELRQTYGADLHQVL